MESEKISKIVDIAGAIAGKAEEIDEILVLYCLKDRKWHARQWDVSSDEPFDGGAFQAVTVRRSRKSARERLAVWEAYGSREHQAGSIRPVLIRRFDKPNPRRGFPFSSPKRGNGKVRPDGRGLPKSENRAREDRPD